MRSKASIALTAAAMLLAATMLSAQTQTQPEPIEKVGGRVSAPRAIHMVEPEFSAAALAAGYEGVSTLSLIVGVDGMPTNIHVVTSIGMGLDEKAVQAVSAWRFSPALKDGKPVAVQIAVEMSFHLGNPDSKFADLQAKAQAGDAEAQLNLANLFLKQKDAADEHLALTYLEQAANQGLPRAQFLMGEHITKKDASADYPKAYMWLTLAQRGGEKHSDKVLKQLTPKMTTDQVRAAQALAASWKPVPPK